MQRRLGKDPSAAVFAGDATVDLLAGNALGIRTLLIPHGQKPEWALAGSAWRVAGTPSEAYVHIRAELIHAPGRARPPRSES